MKDLISKNLLILLVLLLTHNIFSQEKSLVEEWVQKDLNAIDYVNQLSAEMPKKPERIAKILNNRSYSFPEEIGFGAEKIRVSQGYGYVNITVSAFIFEDSIISYRITVGGSLSWSRIRDRIIRAWKEKVQLPFTENENGIYYEVKYDEILEKYKKTVNKELGEARPVKVPDNLKDDYEYLISPLTNPSVGLEPCGVAGMTLAGKESIDKIKKKKIDLLENILRGYNPGGRIYATIVLLEMKKEGLKISEETKSIIKKVINLETKVEFCLGGTYSYKNAKEILQEYKLLEILE